MPIDGEAGLGYLLEPGYDMPPLMLTPDEIEAVVLGAQLVAKLPDPILVNAARGVVAKIASVVPEHLLPFLVQPSVTAKPAGHAPRENIDARPFRSAIRESSKLRLRYRSEAGEETERIVWPVILGYGDTHCLLIAWCELRQDFRHFRCDRILDAAVTGESFGKRRSNLRQHWEQWRETELSGRVTS